VLAARRISKEGAERLFLMDINGYRRFWDLPMGPDLDLRQSGRVLAAEGRWGKWRQMEI